MQLVDEEIHCHVWHDLAPGHLKSAELIPHTLGLYPEVPAEISKADNGKPFLSNSSWQVSVSHSRRLAVVVLNNARPIGCDVEFYKPRRFTRISHSYFHPNESKAVDTALDTMSCFYGLWTLKEAYGKAVGTGLSGTLGRDFSEVIQSIALDRDIHGPQKVRLVRTQAMPGYGFLWGKITPDCAIAIAVETCRLDWTFHCWHHREATRV